MTNINWIKTFSAVKTVYKFARHGNLLIMSTDKFTCMTELK